MKKHYLAIILVFGLQFGFGQIGFEENVISGDLNTVVRPYSVFSADIDGDGDKDLLSASANDNKIAWYEKLDNTDQFGVQKIISTTANGARSVFSADIDNDGDMDVLSASFSNDRIVWYENLDGFGDFGSPQLISSNADEAMAV